MTHWPLAVQCGSVRLEGTLPHETLSLLVRWLHVAAMALALGGALLVWWTNARPTSTDPAARLDLATAYERLFWLALGLLVMTGIGNLGAFGPALPGPTTVWGGRLVLKLAAVLVLLFLSVVRTVLVVRLSAAHVAPNVVRWLPSLYGATSVALAAIALLALFLAHAG